MSKTPVPGKRPIVAFHRLPPETDRAAATKLTLKDCLQFIEDKKKGKYRKSSKPKTKKK